MPGPLHGFRVVDLTSILMGPLATQIMADMGADVIKVEAPAGDLFRAASIKRNPGMGAAFIMANRGKKSVVLDLKSEFGHDAISRLIETADVFIYSMRPKTLENLKLGYEDCRAINPRIVYCGLFGYRQDGPYADRPAYDDIIQGASGLAQFQTWEVGEPRYFPAVTADKTVGISAVYAVSLALLHRERTGVGQRVDVPMMETMVQFNLAEHLAGMAFVPPEGPTGYSRIKSPDRRPFKTKDGHVCVLPYTLKQWQSFFDIIGRPDMKDDPRLQDDAQRNANAGGLYEMVSDALLDWNTADILDAVVKADIPSGVVNNVEDLPNDPQMVATGFFKERDHPTEGRILETDVPIQFSETPGAIGRPAPVLGQDSVDLLTSIGFGEDEIAQAVSDGVTIDGRLSR